MGTTHRAEQILLSSMYESAAQMGIELTAADRDTAQRIARRVAEGWKPGEPLYALWPAERGRYGDIFWDRASRSLVDTLGRPAI